MYAVLALWLVPVTALATMNWVLTLATSLALVEFMSRIPQEEAILLEQFGEEYRAYRSQVGAIGPHLWCLSRLSPQLHSKHESEVYLQISTGSSPVAAFATAVLAEAAQAA